MRPKRSPSLLTGWMALIVLGLLIWAKLRLVAGIPRTVLAEPRDDRAPRASAPAAPR